MEIKENAISELINDLNEIPTDITTNINIKELQRVIEDNMKMEMRRRNSYT